ncbi:MAG: hypothetical protein DME23_03290 [Verrucomicrobia bacterium]|nr:MAG: hypothetical protein DME23_03290 [Verrucomicrobiota bacterium]
MKAIQSLAIVLVFTIAVCARSADDRKLEPDATFRLEFLDLPDTLETLATGVRRPARLTVTLPVNYSREGKFPVFVFLDGGDGGRGDGLAIPGRKVVPRDFICVSLPLFKRAYNKNEGGLISMEDFPRISRAYRVMLQKLLDAVPNTTPERSTLGGFSNGAHTVAVLLAGQDEFILSHFRAFCFVDGGFGPLAANVLHKTAVKNCRFLLLRGDQPEGMPEREHNTHLARALECEAREHHLDFTSIIMRGHGHELPPEYLALLGQWVRGEKLPQPGKN